MHERPISGAESRNEAAPPPRSWRSRPAVNRNRKVHHFQELNSATAQGARRRSGGGPKARSLSAGCRSRAALAQAVALALEGDDLGVVDEPIDQRRGDHLIAEDLAPGLEAAVGCDDHRAAFVAPGNERERGGLRPGVRAAGSRSRRPRSGRSARAGEARRRGRFGPERTRAGRSTGPTGGQARPERGPVRSRYPLSIAPARRRASALRELEAQRLEERSSH